MCILYINIINYILCTTLHYPAQNDCATLFHQSVCSICVMLSDSFHFHTTLHYPTLLYATVHCSTLLCTALGYLHYSTPLYTSLQSTPLCILLSPPPPTQRRRSSSLQKHLGVFSKCFRARPKAILLLHTFFCATWRRVLKLLPSCNVSMHRSTGVRIATD